MQTLLAGAPAGLVVLAHGSEDGLPRWGPWSVVTETRPELVPALVVVVAAVLYLVGVRRLTGRGDAWPVGRTIAFVGLGLGSFAIATMSGLGTYDDSLFAVHMVQHMILAMVTPVFLALGAPVTLALRTLPRPGRGALLTVLHSRVVRVLSFPLVGWVLFVGTPFALYFSSWYPATLEHDWLHQLMHVHFVLVGCLFFWPLLGIDPIPGKIGYPGRMLVAAATLPFHAFLGIAIMSVSARDQLIAGAHYVELHGVAESIAQQQIGGGLLWASGDLVGLLFVFTMLTQWMRASEREAAREDRRLDRLEAAARS